MTRTLIVFTSQNHAPVRVSNLVNVLRNGATIRYIRAGRYRQPNGRYLYGYTFTLTAPVLFGYQSSQAERIRSIDSPLRASAPYYGVSYAGVNLSS